MHYSPWLEDSQCRGIGQLGHFAVYAWRFGFNRHGAGNSYNTIRNKLSSIRWMHKRHLGVDVGFNPEFIILLRGIRRFSDPVRKRHPVTISLLRTISAMLDFGIPRHLLLWGSVLFGFFFLLRRSEYLQIGNKRHGYCLTWNDVWFSDSLGNPTQYRDATSVTISLRGSKNDQYGRGSRRTMHRSGDPTICPVRALRCLQNSRRTDDVSSALTGNVSASEVSRTIKAAAVSRGLDPRDFSTHSVRVGGATSLLNAGVDSLAIKLLGRWMSSCFEEYPVQHAQGTRHLARAMVVERR